MFDWADEIAENIIDDDGVWYLDHLSPGAIEGAIAAALRKAKADALEEAAKVLDQYVVEMKTVDAEGYEDGLIRDSIEHVLGHRADAIRALKDKP